MTIIPESDLYRLIMRSNISDAERFQDWVVEVVLPSIGKTGMHITLQRISEEDEHTHNATELKGSLMKQWSI